MRFSHFFIDRPIFATVLSLIVTIVGLIAQRALPVVGVSRDRPADGEHHRDLPGRLGARSSPRQSRRRSSRR